MHSCRVLWVFLSHGSSSFHFPACYSSSSGIIALREISIHAVKHKACLKTATCPINYCMGSDSVCLSYCHTESITNSFLLPKWAQFIVSTHTSSFYPVGVSRRILCHPSVMDELLLSAETYGWGGSVCSNKKCCACTHGAGGPPGHLQKSAAYSTRAASEFWRVLRTFSRGPAVRCVSQVPLTTWTDKPQRKDKEAPLRLPQCMCRQSFK